MTNYIPEITPVSVGRNKHQSSKMTSYKDTKDSESPQEDSNKSIELKEPPSPSLIINKPVGDNKDLQNLIVNPSALPEEQMIKMNINTATVTLSGDQIQKGSSPRVTLNSPVNSSLQS